MKIVVFNLGCKVNQYESDMLAQELTRLGHSVSEELSYADAYVLNTCAVTNEAERKSRQAVERCRRYNPDARIFVCGCAAQNSAENFKKENVIYITGVRNKKEIARNIEQSVFEKKIYSFEKEYDGFSAVLTEASRTRAYVKIQDGCNSFCSYCLIPYVRGRSVSRNEDEIVSEVRALSEKTQEIVLVGINMMLYGKDSGTTLSSLVRRLSDVDVRLRLSSFYVDGLTDDLLDALFDNKNFCHHFHLSLQSGNDEVLKRMNRHYTTAEYLEKIEKIRAYDDNAAITTDIIVGFPTETDEQFATTVDFTERVGFSDIHVFPYSKRNGTAAALLPQLDPKVIPERRDRLLKKKQELIDAYLKKNIGVPQKVLFEEKDGEYACGYSDKYIKVFARTDKETATVLPYELYKNGLKGDLK